MPNPFLRRDESDPRKPKSDRTVGICVFTPDGKRYFFPGGDSKQAVSYAAAVLGEVVMSHPTTRIEFGDASGTDWIAEKVIKAPPGTATDGPNAEQQQYTVHLSQ